MTYFKVFKNYQGFLSGLNDEQLGKLFRAMLSYANSNQPPELDDPMLQGAWPFIQFNMDDGERKFDQSAQRSRENGSKGGRPKKEQEELPNGESRGAAQCEIGDCEEQDDTIINSITDSSAGNPAECSADYSADCSNRSSDFSFDSSFKSTWEKNPLGFGETHKNQDKDKEEDKEEDKDKDQDEDKDNSPFRCVGKGRAGGSTPKSPTPPPGEAVLLRHFGAEIEGLLQDYKRCRREMRFPLSLTSEKALRAQTGDAIEGYGERAVAELLRQAVQEGTKAVYFDRLAKPRFAKARAAPKSGGEETPVNMDELNKYLKEMR